MNATILCIDDDSDFLDCLKLELMTTFDVATASSIDEGLAVLRARPCDLVLLDVSLGAEDGIAGIARIKAEHPAIDIAMCSGSREPRQVVRAIRAGAIDYCCKPVEADEILAIVERQRAARRVLERYEALVETQNAAGADAGIVTRSPAVNRVLKQAEQLKGHGANVLIVGETGSGKELLARSIHRGEGDPRRPFIAVNCAAIPEHLIEAELFGAEAGAYTGAVKRRIGKFELADGGDIFLDEVGALGPSLQAKILRVLQEHELCRLGGNEIVKTDFRVIAATNEPLEEKVSRGDFRIDLYHRLRVIQLTMPALRDRPEDIPILVEHFLRRFARDGVVKRLTAGAMARLMPYHWPGNVRELANVVQGLTILSSTEEIDESAFPSWALNGCGTAREAVASSPMLPTVSTTVGELRQYVAQAERQYIEHAIRVCGGDKSKAARVLALGRTTLYAKMKELGIS